MEPPPPTAPSTPPTATPTTTATSSTDRPRRSDGAAVGPDLELIEVPAVCRSSSAHVERHALPVVRRARGGPTGRPPDEGSFVHRQRRQRRLQVVEGGGHGHLGHDLHGVA